MTFIYAEDEKLYVYIRMNHMGKRHGFMKTVLRFSVLKMLSMDLIQVDAK